MKLYNKLVKLANEINKPCVTISLNTHRTHPDREKDKIVLKNLLTEAEKRVIHEFGKKAVSKLLNKISQVEETIDFDYNLDSLHIFISNSTLEMIRLAWPTTANRIYIAEVFDVRTIIKAVNRVEDYLIMMLSQGGVNLYHAMNECIVEEIKNDDFPFDETPYYAANGPERSNAKLMDDLIREYFNQVDKALIKVCHEMEMDCIVISTEDNYVFLKEVADNPEIYIGHAAIDYNKTKPHQLVLQAWGIIQLRQEERRAKAISEVKDAVSESKVVTDLGEIYRAATEGRGDLLIVRDDYTQAVNINKDNNLEITDEPDKANVDDVTSNIAWQVISKGGRVFFTCQDDIIELGNIVLKTRY